MVLDPVDPEVEDLVEECACHSPPTMLRHPAFASPGLEELVQRVLAVGLAFYALEGIAGPVGQ